MPLGDLVTVLNNWEWWKWCYVTLRIAHKIPYSFLLFLWKGLYRMEETRRHWHCCALGSINNHFSMPTPSGEPRLWAALFHCQINTPFWSSPVELRWLQFQPRSDWNYTKGPKQVLPTRALLNFITNKTMNKVKWLF